MNNKDLLELRDKLILLREGSFCFLYSPIWGKPIMASTQILGLLQYFEEPRNPRDLLGKDKRLSTTLNELVDAGILGSTIKSDASLWRAKVLPSGRLAEPNQVRLTLSTKPDVSLGMARIDLLSRLITNLQSGQTDPVSLLVTGIGQPEHWSFLEYFLPEMARRLDHFDYLDVYLETSKCALTEQNLGRLRWCGLGVRQTVENSDLTSSLDNIARINKKGHVAVPVMTIESGIDDRFVELMMNLETRRLNALWIEPGPELLKGSADRLLQTVIEWVQEAEEHRVQLLGFWNLPAFHFEHRTRPSPLFLSLGIDIYQNAAAIGNRTVELPELDIEMINTIKQEAVAKLTPTECEGCSAIGHCLGTIQERYQDHVIARCWLTHQMFQRFLKRQFEIAGGVK